MPIKKLDFSHAYEFADAVIKTIQHPDWYDYDDEMLQDFLDFKTDYFYLTISKPQKKTLLHTFIKNTNFFGIEYSTGNLGGNEIVENFTGILISAGLIIPKWFNEKEVRDYICECDNLLEKATEIITESAFHLLFSDRYFLFEFNKMISNYIKHLTPSDNTGFKRMGVLKRVNYLPSWLKNAVYHRDKGRCQICGLDLTNLMVPTEKQHFDHMLPLAESGINDPTNFQLLCENCNLAKSSKIKITRQYSYTYW